MLSRGSERHRYLGQRVKDLFKKGEETGGARMQPASGSLLRLGRAQVGRGLALDIFILRCLLNKNGEIKKAHRQI